MTKHSLKLFAGVMTVAFVSDRGVEMAWHHRDRHYLRAPANVPDGSHNDPKAPLAPGSIVVGQ